MRVYMIVQKELKNKELADILINIDEKELMSALKPFIKNKNAQLLKVGSGRAFKPFKAIKMQGNGATATEMVVQDRI
jgi:hypothetical protein